MPIEFVLFPKWVPISMYKVAYWARTTMVPLLVLCSLKARARNPRNVSIRELFVTPPDEERRYFPPRAACAGCSSRSTARCAMSNR